MSAAWRVGGVARLERRGEPALGPEAGALGERRAGDEADAAAELGGAQRGPEAGGAAADDDDVELRDRGYRPLSLSADRVDALAQPGGGAFAGPRLLVGDRPLGLVGAALGGGDPLLGGVGLRLDLAQPLLGGGDRPLFRLALALQLFLVAQSQLLCGPGRTRLRQRSRSASSAWISASARCFGLAAASAAAASVRSASRSAPLLRLPLAPEVSSLI